MADPLTVGLIGAGATLLGATATGTIAASSLAYNIYKDRKTDKGNGDVKATTTTKANSSYNPNLVYQPSASYQKSGTEQVSFGPNGRFSAVGTSASDWSCGTITYYAPREESSAVGKHKKGGGLFGRNAAPPPYR